MQTKTVKLDLDRHRRLRFVSAANGMPLQMYLELLLDWAMSQEPAVRQLRQAYFRNLGPMVDV